MNSRTLSWLPILSFLSFTTQFPFLQFPLCFCFPDAFFYHSCGNTTFDCGSITGIGYPFRGHGEPEYCGYPGLDLHCQDGITTVYINNLKYRVRDIDQATQTMKIAREDILESVCPQDLANTTLDNSLFEYASSVVNLDFVYGCSMSFQLILSLIPIPSCNISGLDVYLVVGSWSPDLSCESRVTVPVAGWDGSLDLKGLGQAFRGGFKGFPTGYGTDSAGFPTGYSTDSAGHRATPHGRHIVACVASKVFLSLVSLGKMHPQLFPISCIFVAIVALIRLPASLAQGNEQYLNCSQLFQCGNMQGIGYPFWGGNRSQSCGHPSFQLNCTGEAPVLTIESRPYRVLSINNVTYALTVARQEFWNDSCPQYLHNATLDTVHFSYAADTNDLALYYGCTALTLVNTIQNQFPCLANGTVGTFGIFTSAALTTAVLNITTCNTNVSVRVNSTVGAGLSSNGTSEKLAEVLDSGFGLVWEASNTNCQRCVGSGGACGWNSSNSGSFVCYCSDGGSAETCPGTGEIFRGSLDLLWVFDSSELEI
ncbi:hypothetical protein RHSIM_Rhsim08G0083500 [Rhododendron simsii]|uniref:non-specific serine/threonine protein kinase n=1 Tax=Rhododendron simsii TaxID=118357 RepID=A0A834GFS1_RHOSS|nr:hypothetical protein RHSIM_Rhsim08G0083500 [Rhododendron simsii]